MSYEAVFTACGVGAELLVAAVIWYEWEGGRLDQFLTDADQLASDRNAIYKAYCGLPRSDARAQSELFKELLEADSVGELLNHCHSNIRLLSRIGSRLPRVPWLRRTPLDWHIPVLMWVILAPYIEERRREAGPSYADNFLRYALASTKRLLKQERDTWTIRDPDRNRNLDVIITRQFLVQIKKDLKSGLNSKG
jgi:hypothetical protein